MKYIREGEDPFITGDGEQRRDMLHVDDAVSANVFCMEQTQDFEGANFDVGTGKNISLNEMRNIALEYNPGVTFRYVEERPGDVLLTKADTVPLSELGWRTENSIVDGITSCFKGVGKNV